MKGKYNDDYDYRDGAYGLWFVFRIIFAIIVFSIVFGIVFGLVASFINGGVFSVFAFPSWIWNLIGLLFFLWLLSWIFRWPWRHRYFGEEHAIRILRRRYARGEISEAQYKRMMKTLREKNS